MDIARQKEIAQTVTAGKAVLGMEFGSTRIKAVLLDAHNRIIAQGHHLWENQMVDGLWSYSQADIIAGMQDCYAALAADVKAVCGAELTHLAGAGISAMMHGYLAFDSSDRLLVPFRTWRNTNTGAAAEKLTALFNFNIPLRWSVAHLYQCVLDGESHLQQLSSMNTLAGYVHYLLTGRRVLGVGDAAGMFPIDPAIGQYDAKMLAAFDRLVADKNYPWTLADLLPEILPVGTPAGTLTPAGAALLDPSGTLQPGAVFCPPEGDAGTGMVATNSVAPGTGNVSAGTSVFTMVVLDRPLARVHREIDMVTTPCGHPVAMVHANNCSSQVNVIAGLLRDFAAAMGQPVPDGKIYDFLFNSAVDGAPDCDGIVTYGYTSGESILNLDAGRPLTVRRADSTVNWSNLMRSNLCGALAALKVGMDILTRDEQVPLQRIYGHGGFFTTPQVGQRLLAAALAAPVTVMETAGSGGPWGMALLAAYMLQRQNGERLAAFLERQVFACCQTVTVEPTAQDVADFDAYMQAFHAALDLERRAAGGE